ncbi:MAG TPA: hypothetical protein VF883_17825 [Thermoanaerobaculia bacterium]|jgi:hypothetical protein
MSGIARTCLIALVGWLAASVALFFHIHGAGVERQYAFWGATISAFCAVLAVNYAIAVFEEVRERTLLLGAARGAPLVDGKWVAVNGPIHSREPLRAPLSGMRCVAYEYRISKEEQTTDGSREVPCFEGKAFAPSSIAARQGTVRLFAVPKIDADMVRLEARDALDNARAFIEATTFESSETPKEERVSMEQESSNDTGQLRKDRMVWGIEDLRIGIFEERHIAQGETVCAFGRYSQARGGIVPHPNYATRARLMRGDAGIAARELVTRVKRHTVTAIVWSLVAYGVVKLYTTYSVTAS